MGHSHLACRQSLDAGDVELRDAAECGQWPLLDVNLMQR